MKKLIKNYWLFVLIAAILIVLDQWTKNLVRTNLAMGEIWMPWTWLAPYARVVHWYNTGVAFGMFQDHGMLFTILNSMIAGFILIFFPRLSENDWFLKIALSMQFGGAVGNLIDRMTIGHVTDFISVGNFAVFNIADASVTMGVAVMIIGLWIQEKKEKDKKNLLDENQHLNSKPEV
ncbi:MAG: signal peptidase [Chloroflexota bacterium]|nr:signal peptidase [Chloroflexota bacterium]